MDCLDYACSDQEGAYYCLKHNIYLPDGIERCDPGLGDYGCIHRILKTEKDTIKKIPQKLREHLQYEFEELEKRVTKTNVFTGVLWRDFCYFLNVCKKTGFIDTGDFVKNYKRLIAEKNEIIKKRIISF